MSTRLCFHCIFLVVAGTRILKEYTMYSYHIHSNHKHIPLHYHHSYHSTLKKFLIVHVTLMSWCHTQHSKAKQNTSLSLFHHIILCFSTFSTFDTEIFFGAPSFFSYLSVTCFSVLYHMGTLSSPYRFLYFSFGFLWFLFQSSVVWILNRIELFR